ncbi:MAG: hypothetical protein DCC64_09430 [Planctomycetota bacterium]|nr:MAG: hypothetical protein DCC64_09430 [Planctomycetota bacterium]
MNESQDRLLDQFIEEAARKNGPPDLRARILSAARAPRVTGKLAVLPRRPLRLLPIAITALAALLVVTVLANIDFIRDLVARPQGDSAHRSAGQTSPGQAPAPSPWPHEDAAPAPVPGARDGAAPSPAPKAHREQPEETPPGPGHAAKGPESEEPGHATPQRPSPEGEVERPRQPEETAPPKASPPPKPAVIATVMGKPRLKLRYGEDEAWSEHDGGELKSGVQLQVRGYVDLALTSGGLLRIGGEVVLTGDATRLESSILKDELYIDNRGCSQPVTVVCQKLFAELKDGAALFSPAQGALEIACLEGEVSTPAGNVEAGRMKRLTSRGLGAAKPLAQSRMLDDVPARTLLREDFDQEPLGGLYGGTLGNGQAVAAGHGQAVAFRYNPTLAVLPRMAVKMRVRAVRAQRLQLELFEQGGREQPWLIHLTPKAGEWVEITVKFSDLRLRDQPQARLAAPTLLRNFKLYVEGDKDALLEIDWVEFVRLGPQE